MTTDRKPSAVIYVVAVATMTFLLCLGCDRQQDTKPRVNISSSEMEDVNRTEMLDPLMSEVASREAAPSTGEEKRTTSKVPNNHPGLERDNAFSFDAPESELDKDDAGTRNHMEAIAQNLSDVAHPLPGGRDRSDRRNAIRRRSKSTRSGNGDGLSIMADAPTQPAAMFELQPGEELWVIVAAESTDEQKTDAPRDPTIPGCGALLARIPVEPKLIPVPLKHTAVSGTIDGYIASVGVKQQFHNPFDSKIEAVYMFPLPQNAAANEFVMTVGERRIRGIIRERQEAERVYKQARSQGHVAALMTQGRPNVFTQKVANIEPGKQIDIDVRYFNTLQWDNGAYEFVFPMVIGPRFNPPGSTDPIATVARGQRTSAGNEIEYLAPNERSGHDISLTVNVHTGVNIEHIESNHLIQIEQQNSGHHRITLATADSIPNRDFVLRYHVAGDTVKSTLMTHRDQHGQYFTMMLYPPAELSSLQRNPMEMVFVLDCSGSMSGEPLAQSKAAVRQALRMLTEHDTFQIIRFSSNASQLGNRPLPATEDNVQRAFSWLRSLSGSGGTQIISGIKAALDFPHDKGRFRLVTFLTDGYIGHEQQILTTLHRKRGASRVFSFGVGQSPNRYLMDRMALVGRGAVTYLNQNDDATSVMKRFAERISHPALTDIAIDWGDMQVEDVYPSRLPDLIFGRPIVVTGRFTGEPSAVRVGGRVCMHPVDYEIRVTDDQQEHKGIAAVWARHKITDLMNQSTRAPDLRATTEQSVLQTALNYNLMSSYTAFIAVDSMTRTEEAFGTTLSVPVPVPEGVRYDTTVSN